VTSGEPDTRVRFGKDSRVHHATVSAVGKGTDTGRGRRTGSVTARSSAVSVLRVRSDVWATARAALRIGERIIAVHETEVILVPKPHR